MKNFFRVLQAGTLLLIASSAPVLAQESPISIQADRFVATLAPGGHLDFHVNVTNVTKSDVNLQVARSSNYPSDWIIALCAGEQCYMADVTDMFTIKPGESDETKLTIQVGSKVDVSATIQLVFDTGIGTTPQTMEFTVMVSAASGVPVEQDLKIGSLYPNPTSGRTRFDYSLPKASDVTIGISSIAGQRLLVPASGFQEAGDHSLNLDLSTLPAGVYVVTVEGNGVRTSRLVTLAH